MLKALRRICLALDEPKYSRERYRSWASFGEIIDCILCKVNLSIFFIFVFLFFVLTILNLMDRI